MEKDLIMVLENLLPFAMMGLYEKRKRVIVSIKLSRM